MENSAWIKKSAPKNSSEIIGQDFAVRMLKKFVLEKKKAAVIYGPPGCGKTSSVHAIGRELGLEVLEVNASDLRNADSMEETVGNASVQMSLIAKGKIILVDELDGISGQKDRGAIPVLLKLIAKTSFPIAITLNDPFEKKFASLRRKCQMIKFNPLSHADAVKGLSAICKKEGLSVPEKVLSSLAIKSQGDLRSAINDLQMMSAGRKELSEKDLEVISDKDRVEKMASALLRIFKTTDFRIASDAFRDVGETPEDWVSWVSENVPKEYRNPEWLAKAYESISLADVFQGRISRSQHWRLLAYIKLFLTSGVAVAKKEKNPGIVSYVRNARPLKIWMGKARLAKRDSVAEKIAARTRCSPKSVKKDFAFYKRIIKGSGQKERVSEEFQLDQKEAEWIFS